MPAKTVKPRKPVTRRLRVTKPKTDTAMPSHGEIAERAYFIALEQGGSDQLDHWLRADGHRRNHSGSNHFSSHDRVRHAINPLDISYTIIKLLRTVESTSESPPACAGLVRGLTESLQCRPNSSASCSPRW